MSLISRQNRPSLRPFSSSRRLAGYGVGLSALAALVLTLTPLAAGAQSAGRPQLPAPQPSVRLQTSLSSAPASRASRSGGRRRRPLQGCSATTSTRTAFGSGTAAASRRRLLSATRSPACAAAPATPSGSLRSRRRSRSPIASVISSTSPCADSVAPSAPTGITQIAATTTSATISWARSADNFGVTGYGVFTNGVPAGMTAGTSYTFTGLLCGSSYATAIHAFDAAGNPRPRPHTLSIRNPAMPPLTHSRPRCPRSSGSPTPRRRRSGWRGARRPTMVASRVTSSGSTASRSQRRPDDVPVHRRRCGTTHTVGLVAYDAAGNRSDRAYASGPAIHDRMSLGPGAAGACSAAR